MKEKDLSIESLRGIAILLVVALHLTGDPPLAAYNGFYEYIGYAFQNIRMPLFTAISGYLYGLRPIQAGAAVPFLRGKMRRLAVPLACVATLQFLALALMPGVNNPVAISGIWTIYVFEYGHFWFLQSLVLIFLLVALTEYSGILGRFGGWCALFAAAIAGFFIQDLIFPKLTLLSLGGAFYLLPFFLWGYGLAFYRDRLLSARPAKTWIAVFAASFLLQQANWLWSLEIDFSQRAVLGLVIALSGSAALLYLRRPVPILAVIGSYAFTIYMYQAFGSAIGRRIGLFLDLHPHLYFLTTLAVTIVFGIAIERMVQHLPWASTALLGSRSPSWAAFVGRLRKLRHRRDEQLVTPLPSAGEERL